MSERSKIASSFCAVFAEERRASAGWRPGANGFGDFCRNKSHSGARRRAHQTDHREAIQIRDRSRNKGVGVKLAPTPGEGSSEEPSPLGEEFARGAGSYAPSTRNEVCRSGFSPTGSNRIGRRTEVRIWSPPVLQGIVFGVTGIGLRPHIRPVDAAFSASGLDELRAYRPYRRNGLSAFGLPRFSIRRSDLFVITYPMPSQGNRIKNYCKSMA